MRRAALLGALLSTGCAQLFGIDDTTGPTDAMPPVAQVSLSFQRISIGATAIRNPQDLSGMQATYVVPDATDPSGLRRVMAQLTGTDTWTAPLTAAAPVLFTLPDYPAPISRIFDFPVADVHGLYGVLEHPNPTPAPPNAQLAINVGLNPTYNGEGLQVYTIGSWTQRGFAATEIPAIGAGGWAVTVPFSSVGSLTGRPLEKVTTADAVLLLRYTGADLTGALEVTAFDMQDGANGLGGTIQPVARDQKLDVHLDPSGLPNRFAGVRPGVANLVMAWSVVAAPGYEIISNAGPALTSGSVAMATPTVISNSYGNPFTAKHNWPSVFTWSTYETRTFTPAGQSLPVTLYSQLFELAEPNGTTTLALDAGLPITITANGKPLISDGTTITVDPAKAVDISFQADVVANTLYQLQLFELVPNAPTNPTALQYQIRLGVSGTKPQWKLPPELFQTGKNYVLRAICIAGGYPLIAQGDLRMRAFPQSVGLLDGGVFTVGAP